MNTDPIYIQYEDGALTSARLSHLAPPIVFGKRLRTFSNGALAFLIWILLPHTF